MQIVIPSYKRGNLIITHQLFPEAKIVIPESQLEQYNHLDNVITIPDQEDGNIARKRNAILERFKGEDIVMLDDDIVMFKKLQGTKLIPMEAEEVRAIFGKMFTKAKELGRNLRGVYPIENSFYMSPRITSDTFIIGSCMGFCSSNELRFDELAKGKEDYDMTIQQVKRYGGILRADYITHKKKEYRGKGGVAGQRTEENIDRNATEYLLRKRPSDVRRNIKRENEILLTIKH